MMETKNLTVVATPFWPLVFLLGAEARYLGYLRAIRLPDQRAKDGAAGSEGGQLGNNKLVKLALPPLVLPRRKAFRLLNMKETPSIGFQE